MLTKNFFDNKNFKSLRMFILCVFLMVAVQAELIIHDKKPDEKPEARATPTPETILVKHLNKLGLCHNDAECEAMTGKKEMRCWNIERSIFEDAENFKKCFESHPENECNSEYDCKNEYNCRTVLNHKKCYKKPKEQNFKSLFIYENQS